MGNFVFSFLASIVNIIGDYINKLIDFIFKKEKVEPKPKTAVHTIIDSTKPHAWTRKKH